MLLCQLWTGTLLVRLQRMCLGFQALVISADISSLNTLLRCQFGGDEISTGRAPVV